MAKASDMTGEKVKVHDSVNQRENNQQKSDEVYMDFKEYSSLRSELQMRIGNLYNHNFTIVTLIIAIWSFIAKGYIDLLNKESNFVLILAILPIVGGIIVNYLLSQWEENFSGIAALAGYITVFYEMPSLMSDKGSLKLHWGTYTSLALFSNKKKISFANKTYVVASVGSAALSLSLVTHFLYSRARLIYNQWSFWIIITLFAVALIFCAIKLCRYVFKFDAFNETISPIYNFIRIAVFRDGYPANKALNYLKNYLLNTIVVREDVRSNIVQSKPYQKLIEDIEKEQHE
ncbi:MAG: hypothetical protein K2J01_00280 [Clostridiales bacterium]|nr:hypothetical protein [Clostridiales bacterium]